MILRIHHKENIWDLACFSVSLHLFITNVQYCVSLIMRVKVEINSIKRFLFLLSQQRLDFILDSKNLAKE